jgi:small-conductance mechanosensitive channel
VSQRLLRDAQAAEGLAETRQEQGFAADALRLADRELDQAFASALREAAAFTPPPSGPLRDLSNRVSRWTAQTAADQRRVNDQSKATPAEIELAKAQLALDQDELEDAQQDLARAGGDPHAAIARELQQHDAQAHQAAQAARAPSLPTGTLSEQIRAWYGLRDRQAQLGTDRDRVLSHRTTLEQQHAALDVETSQQPAADEDSEAALARVRGLSERRKSLSDLDKRIQDSQQLANVYTQWDAAIGVRRTGVLHQMLNSFALILAVLLAMVLIDRSLRHAFGSHADPRRLQHLRALTTVGIQLVAAAIILLIVFGVPTQTSTILGLATAGLTLVMKDFILSFLGWFVLMGKNGVRVGDWVEIRGVSGEVIEISMLKTVILETGDFGTGGHVTGRRASFGNNYAIEDKYFNFSTAGQWLWDELRVSLPASSDPYLLSRQIREAVEQETEADTLQAESEWEKVSRETGARNFSAKPVVDLRPSVNGLDVIVRYITHAPHKQQVKSRLFDKIVELLHAPVQ